RQHRPCSSCLGDRRVESEGRRNWQRPTYPSHSTPWVYSRVSSQVIGRIALSFSAPSFPKTCLILLVQSARMLVMQEDPDGEENVLATGMVANSRPRDNMTKTTRPPN